MPETKWDCWRSMQWIYSGTGSGQEKKKPTLKKPRAGHPNFVLRFIVRATRPKPAYGRPKFVSAFIVRATRPRSRPPFAKPTKGRPPRGKTKSKSAQGVKGRPPAGAFEVAMWPRVLWRSLPLSQEIAQVSNRSLIVVW